MGWFAEQIEERKERDRILLRDACEELNTAITGKKRYSGQRDMQEHMQNVLDEILLYYHFPSVKIPKSITDFEEKMEYVMRPCGLLWRKVLLEKGWYHNAAGVMLARKKSDGAFVVLFPKKLVGYWFLDADTGKKVQLNKKTQELLEPEGYCFYAGFPSEALGIPDLIKYIAKSISPVTYLMIYGVTFAVALIGMLTPRITYLLYSQVIESRSLRVLLAITVFSICVGFSSALLNMVKNLLNARVNAQLNLSVQAATVARIFSLPPGFFRGYSTGELANKMGSIYTLCNAMISGIFSVAVTSVFSLIYIAQIFKYARGLVLPSVCITLLTIAHTIIVMLLQMRIKEEKLDTEAKNSGMVCGLISGIQKIRLSGSEKRVFAQWLKRYAKEIRLIYRQPFLLKYSGNIGLAISAVGEVVLFYFAIQSHVNIAEYNAFNSAYGMVSGAFLSLVGIASTIAEIRPILKIAEPIMRTEPEKSERKKMVTRLSGNIELDNVSFRYTENSPYVIDDLSLKIKSGQYVAIVGKTGCGKSTLIRLLLGFEKPTRGGIYYDGKDLAGMELQSLRRRIGTVMQDGKLFSGDIYSNITVAAPSATMEDAWLAAGMAGLAQDIRKMPMGMNTLISEGSGGVSGGQRQRIMIARAIAPKPKILIFDEATSALDNLTQKHISESLEGLKCTRIVVAHRLSTICRCDRILYLEKGKIVEDGSYEELIALNGGFADLVAKQRLDAGEGI